MNRNQNYKCILIGDSGTGKTSLLQRYVDKSFYEHFVTTIGSEFKNITIQREEKQIKLQIWDTAGQERFRSILTSYYRGAHGILLVYDLADPISAESIRLWLVEIDKYADEGVPIILVGNKSDLETLTNRNNKELVQETREIISNILLSHPRIKNKECSAKTNHNVEEIFLELTDDMIRERRERDQDLNRLNANNIQLRGNANFNQDHRNCCK